MVAVRKVETLFGIRLDFALLVGKREKSRVGKRCLRETCFFPSIKAASGGVQDYCTALIKEQEARRGIGQPRSSVERCLVL